MFVLITKISPGLSRVGLQRPTKHIICHIGDDFYGSDLKNM